MDTPFPVMHLNEQLTIHTKEHIDFYYHALSHFIINDCKENIFSIDYFSFVSSLKKKSNLNPTDLINSLNGLYKSYKKEHSLQRIQFIPFCSESTDNLFQILDASSRSGLDALHSNLDIDTSRDNIKHFFQQFRKAILVEYDSFYKENRKEIQRTMIDASALSKLAALCTGSGAKILKLLQGLINEHIYVYICPALTAHARMMERDGNIFIAIGDLSTEETTVPRFFNIIHEASHRIVDGLAENKLRNSSALHPEDTETIHLVKEISVIYFNKLIIEKFSPEFAERFECMYNYEKLLKQVQKKGETYGNEQIFQVFLSDLLESIFSYSLFIT